MVEAKIAEGISAEEFARAIYAALEAADPDAFMGKYVADRKLTVDGRFNFTVVAVEVGRRLRLEFGKSPVDGCSSQGNYILDVPS